MGMLGAKLPGYSVGHVRTLNLAPSTELKAVGIVRWNLYRD